MTSHHGGVAAIEAIFRECFRTFAALPDAALVETGEVSGVVTGIPLTFFNGIASTRLASEVGPAIERAMKPFVDRGTPFRWWISPSTRPRDLAGALLTHGLKHAYDATGMAADLRVARLELPIPPGLEIERVSDATALQDWANLLLGVFGRPPRETRFWIDAYTALGLDSGHWRHFVGYAAGRSVATTSLLCSGALAGIYHVATIPEARGRGFGTALTVAAMREAHVAGATEIVLQASDMAVGVYRSLGFETCCGLSLYDWRPS